MIYGGFTYNGKHTYRDLGIVVQAVNRPLLAPQKTVSEDKAFDDGTADYTASNQFSRALYQNRALTVECAFKSRGTYPALHKQAAAVSTWLSNVGGGYMPVVFDDMPLVEWQVKPSASINVQMQLASYGEFSLTFECLPFNNLVFDSGNITLDSDIPLDSDFALGGPLEMVSNNTYIMYNTSAPTRPTLRIVGSGGSLSVTCRNHTLTYDKAWSGEIMIDCKGMRSFLNTNDIEVEGGYFEFLAGDNEVQISGTNLTGTVEMIYPFNVFYGLDD